MRRSRRRRHSAGHCERLELGFIGEGRSGGGRVIKSAVGGGGDGRGVVGLWIDGFVVGFGWA